MVNVFFGYSSHSIKDLFCHFVDDTHVVLRASLASCQPMHIGAKLVITYGTFLSMNFVYYHVEY